LIIGLVLRGWQATVSGIRGLDRLSLANGDVHFSRLLSKTPPRGVGLRRPVNVLLLFDSGGRLPLS
jgi:hypothetical protein